MSTPMLVLCAWHTQYEGGHTIYSNTVDRVWKSMTPLVLQIIKSGRTPISHAICPSCMKKEMAKLEFARRQQETGYDGNCGDVLDSGRGDGDGEGEEA